MLILITQVILMEVNQPTAVVCFTNSGAKLVSWVSKLQSVVAMSTTEAEYVTAAQASKESVWLKMLLEELGIILCGRFVWIEANPGLSMGRGIGVYNY
ncbi:gag-pol polyprotein [Tanacetum coccineum]